MKKSILVKSLWVCLLFLGSLMVPQTAWGAPPDAPSSLVASPFDATSILISWHDNSDDENGFRIYRRTEGGTWAFAATVPANRILYKSVGLTPDTAYDFRVCAYKGDELSAVSNSASATTQAAQVRVISPNGGEDWASGDSHNITWTSNVEGHDAQIRYRYDDSEWIHVAYTANNNSYTWNVPNVSSARVRVAVRLLIEDELVCVDQSDTDFSIRGISLALPSAPNPPTALSASALSASAVELHWTDASENETGFRIERRTIGAFTEIATVGSNVTSYTDACEPETAYTYRIRAYNGFGNSAYSNEAQATTPDTTGRTELRFYIGSKEYYLKGPGDSASSLHTMDAAPMILEGRTLLPITYVAQPLGAVVNWNAAEDRVTVALGSTTVSVFINNSGALVNGTSVQIDPANPLVTPIIVPPGRTMLPLSFIASQLGCQVSWDPVAREVTVVYPKEV